MLYASAFSSLSRRATRCADFKTVCHMLHKALLDYLQTIRRMAQSKSASKSQTNVQMYHEAHQ